MQVSLSQTLIWTLTRIGHTHTHCISMRETPFSENTEAVFNSTSVKHSSMAFWQLITAKVNAISPESFSFIDLLCLKKKSIEDPAPLKTPQQWMALQWTPAAHLSCHLPASHLLSKPVWHFLKEQILMQRHVVASALWVPLLRGPIRWEWELCF